MLASVFALAVAATAPPPVLAAQVWSADSITWTETRPGGAQRAVLEDDLNAPGVVTYAFRMSDGQWFAPHTHDTTARVFVLNGVLLLGQDASGDHRKIVRVTAGEVVLVPGGMAHYEGAEGETVIVGVALGPWTTHFIDTPPR